jgi:hypothetical protein
MEAGSRRGLAPSVESPTWLPSSNNEVETGGARDKGPIRPAQLTAAERVTTMMGNYAQGRQQSCPVPGKRDRDRGRMAEAKG